MKDAEMKADDRQGLANGGEPEEDTVEMEVEKPATKQDIRVVKTTVDNGGKGIMDEDEFSKSIKCKMMLDHRSGRHVHRYTNLTVGLAYVISTLSFYKPKGYLYIQAL